ncbi:hypothetical protein BD779DRAFT_1681780 [Infundibulicybe gibba]|nr:hypothetical protein BD779DRAFT_1681780 [Infundibulicybe gibba]
MPTRPGAALMNIPVDILMAAGFIPMDNVAVVLAVVPGATGVLSVAAVVLAVIPGAASVLSVATVILTAVPGAATMPPVAAGVLAVVPGAANVLSVAVVVRTCNFFSFLFSFVVSHD